MVVVADVEAELLLGRRDPGLSLNSDGWSDGEDCRYCQSGQRAT